jgi:hypothetical protein
MSPAQSGITDSVTAPSAAAHWRSRMITLRIGNDEGGRMEMITSTPCSQEFARWQAR